MHKMHKNRGARTPACGVATPGDALRPVCKQTTYPKLASFRQKTTHRVPPGRLFFPCTKCTKERAKLASFRQKTTHHVPPARPFFPVHKVHKSAWRTHSCVPRRHSWRRFDPVCKQTTYPQIGFVPSKNNSPCPTRSPIFSRAQSAQKCVAHALLRAASPLLATL